MVEEYLEVAVCENCINYKDGKCLENGKSVDLKHHCSQFSENDYILIEDKLKQLHETYERLLHIEDTKRIDVVLAVALSSKLDGIPLWLILVGPSGDMKSVQLNALEGENTYVLHNLTSKTMVNGYADKKKYPDLAPELDGRIVVFPDMAQILKLPPNEKGELWGQLRDLYDGYAGKISGQGSRAKYSDLKVTLLAGSTPNIDGQILVHQDLGTRELIYRTKGNIDKNKVMEKCFFNESQENNIKKELRDTTQNFLKHTKINREDVPFEILDKIKEIAIYISYMRATAEVDGYTNTLRNEVYPEEPTRISKQLKRLFICLKSLSENYSDERALSILWHIAKSSAFPLRIKIFEFLLNLNDEQSTSQISERLKIGKGTAQRELQIMWNMGFISLRRQETSFPDRFYDYWRINNNNNFIQKLKEMDSKPSGDI